MKFSISAAACLLLCVCGINTAAAGDTAQPQDPRAIEALNAMSAYVSALDTFRVSGRSDADARLDAGLIVSNSSEITMKVDQPSSLYLSSFDGVDTRNIYLHNGKLTVLGTEKNFYAQAKVPEDISEGMRFALHEFDVETPIGELFFSQGALDLLLDGTEVIYLTDTSRVDGVDCHQIAIRGPEVDMQLWIEKGTEPAPRKVLMTMKWEGGSPRYTVVLNWEPVSGFDPGTFEFKPPEGAMEIQFMGAGQ